MAVHRQQARPGVPDTMYHWNSSTWTVSRVPIVVDQLCAQTALNSRLSGVRMTTPTDSLICHLAPHRSGATRLPEASGTAARLS